MSGAHPRVIEIIKGEYVNVQGQALQEEHRREHASALDLRQRLCRHLALEVLLRVQPVALAVARAPRAPGPLRRLHSAAPEKLQ